MNAQIDVDGKDFRSSVQDYLLPQAFTKRQWSLFAFIRINNEIQGQRPERFAEFLRKLIGESGDGLELQLDWWDAQNNGEVLDANVFFKKGLLGVLAHEFIRINLLSLASKNHSENEKHLFKLLKNRLDTETQQAHGASQADIDFGSLTADNAQPMLSLDPVDLAFTHSGLTALGIDPYTLDSFPEAFRQGMAARTHLTGDGPADAPETWEGALGQRNVHAMLTLHFPVEEKRLYYWDNLEQEIAQFNRDAWQWPVYDTDSRAVESEPHSLSAQTELAEQVFGWLLPQEKKDELTAVSASGLRDVINKFTEYLGFEILHLELGQIPYELEDVSARTDGVTSSTITKASEKDSKTIRRSRYRREHFGFRDGISQPFLDINGSTPSPGGGTPQSDGSWKPVAPGEIFLGEPDEDHQRALQPFNSKLMQRGTYLVFRKLEQDVVAFRSFLAQQHSHKEDQNKLAAQIVGRWPDGAPVVRYPESDVNICDTAETRELNDFCYLEDDPLGQRCPIGSHVRRSNPRDTSGRDDVKRHRILRRGMPYGGPLLPEGSIGDGRKRGLLFICLNSKIDIQFELIQREWINSGEFLGQVGAGKCPLTGANQGRREDQFLTAGAIAPIVGIPAFVRNRGGDYFFVPSLDAVKHYVDGETFAPDMDGLPHGKYSATRAETPGLLNESRVRQYGLQIFTRQKNSVRVRLPGPPEGQHMTFVGRYKDVVTVLGGTYPEASGSATTQIHGYTSDSDCPRSDQVQCGRHLAEADASSDAEDPRLNFSVAHYFQSGREITRGSDLLIAMDPTEEMGATRRARKELMHKAWSSQTWIQNDYYEVRNLVRQRANALKRQVSQVGYMDILQDLAFDVCYRVLCEFVGLHGPKHLTELAVSLPFARRNITDIPPGWLDTKGSRPQIDEGYQSSQLWARVAFGEVIGNVLERSEFTAVAAQATSEMLTHIDEEMKKGRLKYANADKDSPQNVLQYLVQHIQRPEDLEEARITLADLLTTISMNIALPFSKALQNAFELNFDINKMVTHYQSQDARARHPSNISRVQLFVYELLRIKPSAEAIFRRCEKTTTLASGAVVQKGDWVAALVGVASKDPETFGRHSFEFSHELAHDPAKYLLFGPNAGIHRCWGSDLGSVILEELFVAAAQFKGLQPVAGERGKVQQFFKMDYSWLLKFHPFKPD